MREARKYLLKKKVKETAEDFLMVKEWYKAFNIKMNDREAGPSRINDGDTNAAGLGGEAVFQGSIPASEDESQDGSRERSRGASAGGSTAATNVMGAPAS